MKQKVFVKDLAPGMFVDELDRPWLGTPYLIQGILIQSQEDIQELARHCTFVYIDSQKSDPRVIPKRAPAAAAPPALEDESERKTPFHGQQVYVDTRTVEEELPAAKQVHEVAARLMDQVKRGVARDLKLDVAAAQQSVDAMRESIVRNPDALLLLARLKASGGAEYDRAIDVSVYLLALGRHLGLPKEELSALGLGGLLMDIGKLRLPPGLLSKDATFTPVEHTLMKKHVLFGEAILTRSPGIADKVIQIVAQHHEREDGSGYPRGLPGSRLNPYGRMAAIVDCYEDLVFQEPGATVASPYEALKLLRDWSRRLINATLVEQFAHCVGLFPVGSLVELNSGEVAIVLTHSRSQRFRPRVMIVLDAKKAPCEAPRMVDLRTGAPGPDGLQYEIVHDLKYGAYGIDPRRYYL